MKDRPVTEAANIWKYTLSRFGTTATRVAMQTILLPLVVSQVFGAAEKTSYLSYISVVSLLAGLPLFVGVAYLGDVMPLGSYRRRAFMILGCLLTVSGMMASSAIHDLASLTIVSLMIFCGICMGESAHSALIPDNFSSDSYLRASAWLTKYSLLGAIAGPILAGILLDIWLLEAIGLDPQGPMQLVPVSCMLSLLIIGCTWINSASIHENALPKASEHKSKSGLGKRLLQLDRPMLRFHVYLILRTFALLPAITMPSLLLFLRQDAAVPGQPLRTTVLSILVNTAGALLGLLLIKKTRLSRFSELRLMQISLVLMILSVLGLGLEVLMNYGLWYPSVLLLGCGFSMFFSTSFSYALHIIPDMRWRGLFSSLATATTFIAFLLGMLISGPLVQAFALQSRAYGYSALAVAFTACLLMALALSVILEKFFPEHVQ